MARNEDPEAGIPGDEALGEILRQKLRRKVRMPKIQPPKIRPPKRDQKATPCPLPPSAIAAMRKAMRPRAQRLSRTV